jgi:hypothetical protein
MLTAIRSRLRDDAGIGMILVLGITVFVAGLTVTAATIAQNGLGQSRQRINFERSMAASESGIDYALGHLQYAFDEASEDYPIPAEDFAPSSDCPVVEIELPDLKNVNEKQWAKQQLRTLVEEHPECLIDTPDGQVMVLKPKNPLGGAGIQYGRVYAMGWSPGYGQPRAVSRTVKAEYVFMPYRPKHAILTGQSLTLQSTSTDVMGAYGVNPNEASVHTNGDLTVVGQPTVTGPVSYSGAASGDFSNFKDDAATKKKDFRIPRVSARAFYKKAPVVDKDAMPTWTDLCPDGTAKAYSALGPCMALDSDPSPHKGWSFDASTHTWTASKDTASGTYFVHEADVANGTGNGSIPNITVIASSAGQGCTDKQYGNIVWDHYDTPAPAFTNLFFMADGDLSATSNFYSGQSSAGNVVSGMYVAGEEILIQTSSSGLVGAVLAANQCPSDTGPVASNEVQGQIVKFDPKSESPFSSLISTTLWLEYVG